MAPRIHRGRKSIQMWKVIPAADASCLLASLLAWWTAGALRRSSARPEAPTLDGPQSALAFGTVWETDAFVWSVPIVNRSGRQIDIADFVSNCVCTTITPRSFSLEPGERIVVSLKLDLRRRGSDAQAAVSDFGVDIVPKYADGRGAAEWVLAGKVRRVCRIMRPAVELGT